MASSFSAPMCPDFEVLHFKKRQGENLKDAWYRMMESYHKCTLVVNFRILLHNLYVGLNMTHRQLLDCIAKGNFIEIDPSIAHEIIEGIVGTLPQKGGSHPTQEETQVFGKICEVQFFYRSLLSLLKVSGNLHRMNMLITLCNKRLDSLYLKIPEYEGKRKELPGFEHNSAKKIKDQR